MFNTAFLCQSSSSDMGMHPHACRHFQTHSVHKKQHSRTHFNRQSSCWWKHTWKNMKLLDILYLYVCYILKVRVCLHVSFCVLHDFSFQGHRASELSLTTCSLNIAMVTHGSIIWSGTFLWGVQISKACKGSRYRKLNGVLTGREFEPGHHLSSYTYCHSLFTAIKLLCVTSLPLPSLQH